MHLMLVVLVVLVVLLVDTIDGFRYKNIIRNHYHNRHYHQLLALSSTTKTGSQKQRPLVNRLATLLKKKKGKSVVEDGIDTDNVNKDNTNVNNDTDNDDTNDTNDTNDTDNDDNDINANNATYDIDDLELLMNEGETMLKKTMDIKDKAMSTLKASSNELIAIIQKQINLRCLARKNMEFTLADDIFDRLETDYGVNINDKQNFWYSDKHGIRGPCFDVTSNDNSIDTNIIPQFKTCSLSNDDIQNLVNERIIARRQRNFKEADRIRSLLTLEGIELKDSDNLWSSYDGKLKGVQSNDFDKWLDDKAKDKYQR